ncbi:MAG: hypothetical protein Q4D02_05200 [Clostridia bacterium]|nr:hypothetical protein [Clostridia bacterium]
MLKYILVAIYLVCTTSGMALIKLGGSSTTMGIKDGNFALSMSFISILGYLIYIVSFLLWTKILTMFDLSYIVPIATGISQIIILLMAMGLFHENISIMGFIGIALTISGVICMNIK